MSALDDVAEFADHGVEHGVAIVWPVDGDVQDFAVVFDDQFIAHGFLRAPSAREAAAVREIC